MRRDPSRFAANIAAQPGLVRAILSAPRPSWMGPLAGRRAWLVGVGTNFHAARLAAWEWARTGADARAVHAHDYVAGFSRARRGDLAVFLSHRGGRSFTVEAEALARRAGAETVAIAGEEADWKGPPRLLCVCPPEDTVAFTMSLTATLAWLLRWSGGPALSAFRRLDAALSWGPRFPAPRADADLILVGDGPREWIAHEAALKLQETAGLTARAFGLEQFLHGPRLSAGENARVVAFGSAETPEWARLRRFLKAVSVPLVEVRKPDWAGQLVWAQRWTLDACRRLGLDPDRPRGGDPLYARALGRP